MNKRCTNSSCRRTFSTLNFDGKCPHCGKYYPQLDGERIRVVSGTSHNTHIKLCVRLDEQDALLNIMLDEMLRMGRNGEKIKMIQLFRSQIQDQGYYADLKTSREFCERMITQKRFLTEWHPTGKKRKGLKMIEPFCRNRSGS